MIYIIYPSHIKFCITRNFRVALKDEEDFASNNKQRKGSVFATIGKALGTVRRKQMLKG